MSKTVQVYDFTTKKLSSIPAAELSPDMMETELIGIGRVWVDASQTRPGPYQHPPFTEDVRQYFRQIKESLDEVYPLTLEQWEDGFRRDIDATGQIALWVFMASIYQRCTAGRALSHEQRLDYFKVILACSASPREHVFHVVEFGAISREEAEQAVKLFYSPQG